MDLRATDLIRVARLIKLGAETARSFTEMTTDGKVSAINDAANRIDTAADDLIKAANEMGAEEPD